MPNVENNLLKRSPRSRKSLAVGKSANTLSPKRKRAHSIVPGEKIKLAAPRRSILRPPRGILKPSNQSDLNQDTFQNVAHFLPPLYHPNAQDSIDASTSSLTGDFYSTVNENTARKSLGRRVSFAAHAHVRVFETNEQRANENSPPQSSLPSNRAKNVQYDGRQSSDIAETSSRQSFTTGVEPQLYSDQDGEESMELSDDNIVPPISNEDMSISESMSQASDSFTDDTEEGNMSITEEFGDGIFAQRQAPAVISEPRRRSRMRSSITVPASVNGTQSTDFTVSVDRSPPPETDAFRALKAMANGNRLDPEGEGEEIGEIDMDVTTAVSRLIAARNSISGSQADNSFSTEGSMDAEDDHTMNMTSVMDNLQGVGMGTKAFQDDQDDQETMSVASVVGDSLPNSRVSISHSGSPSKENNPQSRIPIPILVPKFTKSIGSGSALPITSEKTPSGGKYRRSSVIRETLPIFKPQVNSDIRPPSPKKLSLPEKMVLSSNQKAPQIVINSGPAEHTQLAGEEIPKSTRRPSGYYRKSLGSTSVSEIRSQGLVNKDAYNNHSIEHALLEKSRTSLKDSPRSFESDSQDSLTMGDTNLTGDSVISPSSGQDKLQSRHSVSIDSAIEDNMDPISIEQFLIISNIRFMDDLTCPRRSIIHPSQMKRQVPHEDSADGPPLSSYVIAMAVHVAQLETMIWISNDIKTAINKYNIQYKQTEDDVAKDIPLLFREYFAASDEDREPILYVLKLIKTNTISSAKTSWYEWKRGWIQGLQVNALRTLENLHADENQLLDFSSRAGETVPLLRAEYESILQELENERAEIFEIEQCDQQFLSELKTTIVEQSHELDLLRAELADGENKLKRLHDTVEELRTQTEQAEKAVKAKQRQLELQKTSTRAEVFRLREELQCLQGLHLWKIVNMDLSSVELLYDSKYQVIIPCRRFTPVPEGLQVSPIVNTKQDDFPLVGQLMVALASRYAVQSEAKATLRSIIQRLSDFWASYFQLRWQLNFIIIKYPLSCQLLPSGSTISEATGFQVTATLLLLNKTAKARISFLFNEELLSQWPTTLPMLQYTVQVVYGQLKSDDIEKALRNRLSEAKPEENHACLADACMEVMSRYG